MAHQLLAREKNKVAHPTLPNKRFAQETQQKRETFQARQWQTCLLREIQREVAHPSVAHLLLDRKKPFGGTEYWIRFRVCELTEETV